MPKLIVSELLRLDGVMQAPGDPNEDRSGGFDQGGSAGMRLKSRRPMPCHVSPPRSRNWRQNSSSLSGPPRALS